MWIQHRLNTVYGIASDSTKENGEAPKRDVEGRPLEATHVMHVIDWNLWPEHPTQQETDSLKDFEDMPKEYIVTVGRISHVKGTWDTLQSLKDTGLSLVQVGGGSDADKGALLEEGKRIGVEVICMPRLSQTQLCALIRSARAMVSHAHHEPFGLTPIEAMAIGVPALMVDEGGYRHTVEDGISGRLLPRDDWAEWHQALEDAANPENRKAWAKAGQDNIAKMGLQPEEQASTLAAKIEQLRG